MPEAISTAPPMTPTVPPVDPTTSEPSITISASEFHGLVATLQTLSPTQAILFQQMAEMRSQKNQHTAILRQIQQHLGLLPPPQPDLPVKDTIPEPLAQVEDTIPKPLAPVEDTIPAKDITTIEVKILPPQEVWTLTRSIGPARLAFKRKEIRKILCFLVLKNPPPVRNDVVWSLQLLFIFVFKMGKIK